MYDTVNFWLAKENAKRTDLFSLIPPLLTNRKESYFPGSNTHSINGNLRNYRISLNERGVSLKGSLCKFYLNDNIKTLTMQSAKEALNMLSEEIHLPLTIAKVTRIDFAANFIMKHKIPYYFSYLGNARYFKRLTQNNGVYYRNSIREMLFYDKIEEQRKNGYLSKELKSVNLLRYEYRLKKQINSQFNLPEIVGSTLLNDEFYRATLNRWNKSYLTIHKLKVSNFEPKLIGNMKGLENQLLLAGIRYFGGEAIVMQMIENSKSQGAFQNRMQFKRCKDKIKRLCNSPLLVVESEAINELDFKIRQQIEHGE